MLVLGINSHKMKSVIKYKFPIIVSLIGATGGLAYWYFIGCASGNCGITANWYSSIAVGSVMGWLVGDIAKDKINKK
tara:strand:+ start:5339 stop:5569 length:231 start_codon:yes stop_codon:yes gene_type:complete